MGRIKDLFIQMVNEEWERLSLQERALILAERKHMEDQIMAQINAEEQLPAKITVIKEEKKEEDAKDRPNVLPF